MPPNRFESEVESFLEGSHGDRTHIKRADHHTVTPLCGTLLSVELRLPVLIGGVRHPVDMNERVSWAVGVGCWPVDAHLGPIGGAWAPLPTLHSTG